MGSRPRADARPRGAARRSEAPAETYVLLPGELEPHLGLEWVVLHKNLPGQLEVCCLVVQPGGRELVAELGVVAGRVLQQESTAVAHLHVHVTLQRPQQVGQVGPDMCCVGVGRMVKVQDTCCAVEDRGAISPWPGAVVPVLLGITHQIVQFWLRGCVRDVCAHDSRPVDAVGVFKPDQEVQVDTPGAMIRLTRAHVSFAFPVLEFETSEDFHHVGTGSVATRQDVPIPPSTCAGRLLSVGSGEEAFGGLEEQVREVERLCRRKVRAAAAGLVKLVLKPVMIGRRQLQGGHSHEHGGEAELAHAVHEAGVHVLPVKRREAPPGQGAAKIRGRGIAGPAQRAPHPEIIHKVGQGTVGAIANHRRENLGDEASLGALARGAFRARVLRLLFLTAAVRVLNLVLRLLGGLKCGLHHVHIALRILVAALLLLGSRKAPRIHAANVCFAHGAVPIEMRPNGRLQADRFQKAQRQPGHWGRSVQVAMIQKTLTVPQKLSVRSQEVAVWAGLRSNQPGVGGTSSTPSCARKCAEALLDGYRLPAEANAAGVHPVALQRALGRTRVDVKNGQRREYLFR